jgi:hypothetical protein
MEPFLRYGFAFVFQKDFGGIAKQFPNFGIHNSVIFMTSIIQSCNVGQANVWLPDELPVFCCFVAGFCQQWGQSK